MADTIAALIEYQARQRPDASYLVAPETGGVLTYRELCDSSRRIAALTAQRGLARGDGVSIVCGNSQVAARVLLGSLYAGLRVNPVNLLSQPEQMQYVLDHSDSRFVFVAPEWAERVRAMTTGLNRDVQIVVIDPATGFLPGEDAGMSSRPRAYPRAADDAILMYTSGTTGRPKGVLLTHANLVANAKAISAQHRLASGDRVLAVLPLYHINGLAVTLLAPLAHGGSLVMPHRFSSAAFWPLAIEHACTWINVVPTMISYLLEGAAPERDKLGRIRFCRSASAALPPEHHVAFERKFGIPIVETMGLTETVAPAFSNPLEPELRKIGSVGRASGCEARVVGSDLSPVPDGAIGEIVIRGPQVMRGYYKNEPATRDAITGEGWLRTGDLGYRDADGFFFITGRIKELIIKGGENIAPREIDEALLKHPAVLDAAAVGIPDRHYGQEIMACVVLREPDGCTEDELRSFCIGNLGRYKTPSVFRFVSELPRGPSGKVQRLKLVKLLAGEPGSMEV